MAIQNLRSSSAHKRPIPTVLSSGQIAINTNEASPGLFFKDSNGDLVKVGPVHIGTSAPNSSPATTAADALVSGTVYQILTVGNTDFTAVGASANTVGTVFTATGAGTGTGTVSGQQGNEKGEQWLDTTGGAYDLKIYDGSAWRSQAGEFVNHTGDTMTGVLEFVSGSASAPGIAFSGDTNTGIYRPGADQVAIATGGVGRLFVDSNGDVSIEDASADSSAGPEFSLYRNSASPADGDYLGQIRFDGENDTGGKKLYAKVTGKTSDVSAGSEDGLIETAVIKAGSQTIVSRQTGTDLKLINGTGLQVDGNVGIGTTSPSEKLEVNSGTGNTPLKLVSTDGSVYISLEDSATTAANRVGAVGNNMVLHTNNTERLRIDSSGNVGIGTSAPGVKLVVEDTVGTVRVASSDDTFVFDQEVGRFEMYTPDGSGGGAGIAGYTAAVSTSVVGSQYALAFGTKGPSDVNAAERLRIDQLGNVGIGTTSPTSVLHIKSDVSNELNNGILFEAADSTHKVFRVLENSTGEAYSEWFNQNSLKVLIRANGNSYFNGGNVGIGTSSPSTSLHLSGSADTYLTLQAGTTDGNDGILFKNSAGTQKGAFLYDTDDNYLLFNVNESERMRIDSSGNVGIGTTSPSVLLHVS